MKLQFHSKFEEQEYLYSVHYMLPGVQIVKFSFAYTSLCTGFERLKGEGELLEGSNRRTPTESQEFLIHMGQHFKPERFFFCFVYLCCFLCLLMIFPAKRITAS